MNFSHASAFSGSTWNPRFWSDKAPTAGRVKAIFSKPRPAGAMKLRRAAMEGAAAAPLVTAADAEARWRNPFLRSPIVVNVRGECAR